MTVNITLDDPDSTRALTAMLTALSTEGDLDAHEEMVVDRITTACFEQELALDPDDIDEHADDIINRLC